MLYEAHTAIGEKMVCAFIQLVHFLKYLDTRLFSATSLFKVKNGKMN
jgi:hypothetical protein